MYVPAAETVCLLEIKRRDNVPAYNRLLQIRGVIQERVHYFVPEFFSPRIPISIF